MSDTFTIPAPALAPVLQISDFFKPVEPAKKPATPLSENSALRAYAAGVAADIRAHGHYQGQGRLFGDSGSPDDGLCCVVASPTNWSLHHIAGYEKHDAVKAQLVEALGFKGPWKLPEWSDNTPTEDVLAALDAVARGEDPRPRNKHGETVQEEAARIADNLRTYGHYQRKPGQTMGYTDAFGNFMGQACFVVGPTPRNGHTVSRPSPALLKAIGREDIAQWSDTTPTRDVLDVLDGIAAS